MQTSLFLTGVQDDIIEEDVRSQFYVFGDIKSVHIVRKSNCAFVNFAKRSAAESAAESCFHGIDIKGHHLRVVWGRSKPLGPSNEIKAKEQPGLVFVLICRKRRNASSSSWNSRWNSKLS